MTKRIFTMLMAVAMLLSCIPLQIFATDVTGLSGSGTSNDPYKLSTAAELVFAAEQMNASNTSYTGKYYKLTNDIDLSSVESFPMINNFTGNLDGDGHSILNLTITDTTGTVPSNGYGIAFIHKVSGTVRNLTFDGAVITSEVYAGGNGYSGAAVVAAEITQNGLIYRVTVKNSLVNAPKVPKAGGITSMNARAGRNDRGIIGTISNCVVTDTTLIGGPRAENNAWGLMMGGIAGYSATSVIENCYVANVTIQAASETTSPFHAGMICGYGSGGIMDGNVAASGKIERLAAEADQKFNTLKLGGICPSNNSKYGTLTPENGNLIDTANAVGGTAGCVLPGTVVTVEELALQETYMALGWDFDDTWKMSDGVPCLRAPSEMAPLRLEGAGTSDDPFIIGSTEDLIYMVNRLNIQDPRTEGKYYALTSDIDLAGINFTPIDNFNGTFDGGFHTIKNLTVTDDDTSNKGGEYRLAFIRTNTGTVKDLTFESPVIKTQALSTGGYSGASVVVGDNAHGAVISGCVVTNAVVEAPYLPKAAGIAVLNGRSSGINATIRNCVFEGELLCGPRSGNYGPQLGGIAAYSATSTIEYCLANADIVYKPNDSIQSSNVHAGIICGYPNSVNFKRNVAYGGSVTIEGDVATQNLGRIYGYTKFDQTMTDNLACENITFNGTKATDTHAKQGISIDSEALTEKETYENIGWNFELLWKMNDGTAYPDRYPLPKAIEYSNDNINMLTASIIGDNAQSIGFTWHYLAGKNMNVLVSTDRSFAENVLSFSATSEDTCYKAEAVGLEGATTYYYRVEGDSQVSDIGTFTTASSEGSFSFISVADTEAADFNDASSAAASMSAARLIVPEADFILHSGDFTDSSRGAEGWQDLLYQASDSLLAMPMVPTVGEEDTDILDYFNLENTYYSFDYSNAHIIVLDTSDDQTQCLSDEQIAWLKNDVSKTDKDWVILSMHKGPYTSGEHANDPEVAALRDLFISELDDIGIDLVIQGHDHIMGHTYDLKDGELTGQPVYTETVNGKRFDYTIDPKGIVYMMSGGAGSEIGEQMDCDDLDEYIMKFSRSDGRGAVRTFAAITVNNSSIDVATYEIKIDMEPTMIEGFGIDKEISAVEALIADGDFASARKAYNALSSVQKGQVDNYSLLITAEGGDIAEDGGAWLDDEATERRSIVVRNDTDLAFTHAPVLVKLENAVSENMAFYTTEGEKLPYEIESYDPDGISNVWVKVPELPTDSAATLWVYFGGTSGINDSEAVWSDSYALVEHFDAVDSLVEDSTGKQSGSIAGTITSVDNNGDMGADFDGASKITYDSIGDDYNHLSISAVVSLNTEDLVGSTDGMGIVSKYAPGDPNGKNTYLLGVDNEGKLHTYYGCMWWRTKDAMRRDYITELLADGQPHLITVAYDGFTVETFIDGESVAWETVFIESAAFLSPNTPTTIGAYSSYMNDQISGGFKGTVYDVQINGTYMTTQWESFRYNNYFGDAVTVGQSETRNEFTLTIDEATRTNTAEAGKQSVVGVISKMATLTAQVNGKSIDLGEIEAGRFEVYVSVIGTGTQNIVLTAEAEGKTATAALDIDVADTTAPEQPELSVTEHGNVLNAQTAASDGDTVSVDFHVGESIALNASNTKVASSSTEAKTPDAIDPLAAEYTDISDDLTTTVEDGTNPYQIYQITLTEIQAAQGKWRFCWQGESSRQLHAYGYDSTAGTWVKLTSSEGTGILTMNIEMEGAQYLNNNTLYLMIFRGMGQEFSDLTSFIPEEGQYDFTMFWNSDTQYMTQFREELAYHQHEWIADSYEDLKGVITFNTGDVSNRSNLNYEYNWEVVDKSYEIFEEAGIPYTLCWGNHDLDYDDQPNENRYYQTYFPTSRMTENAGDWEVSYAPDDVTGTTTRAMALKNTLQGAKIMILSLAYNPRLTDSDLEWAENQVKDNSDYTVIIITHNYASNSKILSTNIRTRIADKYDNVKLVLSGHLDGTAAHKMSNGGFSVLQDYQGENGGIKHGGSEFMKLIQFDVENDLIYFNTYSPMTGETLSPYGEALDTAAEGLYQKNGDEFALNIALNGDKTRSFTTSSLTMTAGEAILTKSVTVTEGELASISSEELDANTEYVWYVTLTDTGANTTVTPSSVFTPALSHNEAILEAVAPTCTETGLSEGKYCDICGEILIAQEAVAATGHSFTNYESNEDASCTEDGTKTAKCDNCDATDTVADEGSAFGHTGDEWTVTKETGYGIEGEEELHCAVCGELLDTRSIDMLLFPDVTDPEAWYYEGVYYCAANGYIAGTDKGTFAPNGKLTREQFVVILARVAGAELDGYTESSFADVKANSWYGPSVIWAASEEYVKGIGDGTNFGVGQDITREQIATMFYRYAENNGVNVSGKADLDTFTDANTVGSWAKDACAWAIDAGLLGSTSQSKMLLAPKMTVTRAQAAKIFMSYDKL